MAAPAELAGWSPFVYFLATLRDNSHLSGERASKHRLLTSPGGIGGRSILADNDRQSNCSRKSAMTALPPSAGTRGNLEARGGDGPDAQSI